MAYNTLRLHFLILALLFSLPAMAQTLTSSAPTSSLEAEASQKEFILLVTQPTQPVAVDSDTPVDVEFRITGQRYSTGEPAVLTGLNNVKLRGLTRTAPSADGEPVIQVLITDIERNGNQVPLEGFATSWLVEEDTDLVLSLSDQVVIKGNRQLLVDALASLQVSDADEAEEPLQVETNNEGGQQAESSGDSGERSGNGTSAGSGYTTPDPVETTPDPEIVTTETKTGCEPRVDLPLRVAIDQILDQTFTDGALTEESECYDSYHTTDKYPLERDYDSCPIKVNLGGLNATERYKWYYINGNSSRIDVAAGTEACIDDTTRTYAISEDHDACNVDVDTVNQIATPLARLIYQTSDGVAHEVRACQPSTTLPPTPLRLNSGLCPQPENGQELAVHTYQLNNVVHQVGVCSPTGTRLEALTDYDNCGIRIDKRLETVFRQVRNLTVQTGPDSTSTEKSDCYDSYDPNDRTKLVRDYAACEVTEDGSGNNAIEHFRYYYNDTDGTRHDVDQCQPDTLITYTYFEEYEGCGFEHADGFATPRSRQLYQTRDGLRHQVEECRVNATDSRPKIKMTFNTDVCENPDGSTARSPYNEQGLYQYSYDGVLRSFGECQDTGHTIEYRADYDNCSVQVDTNALTAYSQFQIEELRDGIPQNTTRCLSSDEDPDDRNRPIWHDYAACTPIEDTDPGRRIATDRYKLFYTDSAGRNLQVKSCTLDPDLTYAIIEDHEACSIEHNAGEAIPQSRLIYQYRTGVQHEVRACEPSESRDPIAMKFNPDLCSNPAGTTARSPFNEQGIYQYSLDGVLRSVGECQDTGRLIEYRADYDSCSLKVDKTAGTVYREYRIEELINGRREDITGCLSSEEDAGNLPIERDYAACSPSVDITGRLVTDRYELFYIEVGGPQGRPLRQRVESCQDDTDLTYAIFEDHEACSIDHNDDQALPQARLMYQLRDGSRHEVRECGTSESRAAITMAFNPELCENPDGSTAHSPFDEQGRYEYTLDGVLRSFGDCQSTGRSIEYRADYDSCGMRVDKATQTVYREFRVEEFIDDSLESYSTCTFAENDAGNLPIERDYAACSPTVDLTGRLVTDRFELFYTDSDGDRQRVERCATDPDLTYVIFEDHEACSIDHDDDQALPQARLMYQLRDGSKHEVRACDTSESRDPIAMTFNPELCENPDGSSIAAPRQEQGIYQYTYDGVLRSFGGCESTGRIVEYRADYDSCSLKVDKSAGIVYREHRLEELVNGSRESISGCVSSESDVGNLPIERDYAACTPTEDLTGRLVTDRFELFYTESDGTRNRVQSCQTDSDLTYAIFEDHEACSIEHADGEAVPQARLIYQLRDGEQHEVRECSTSESRPAITMTLNPELCENPDGTSRPGTFDEQGLYQYTLDGVLRSYGECQDTGRVIYYHIDYAACSLRVDRAAGTVYQEFTIEKRINGRRESISGCLSSEDDRNNQPIKRDYAACTRDVDLAGRLVTDRFETYYTDEGIRKRDESCRPDSELTYSIYEDHEACSIEHTDGEAVPQARLIYQLRDGEKHEVRECDTSESRAAITMAFNTDMCENPDGTVVHRSFREQGLYQYRVDGVLRSYGSCQDTGRRIEYRADYDGCGTRVDEATETVYRQYQLETVIDGTSTAQSSCQSVAGDRGNRPLERDYAACDVDYDFRGMTATRRFQYTYEDRIDGVSRTYGNCRDDADQHFVLLEDHESCEMRIHGQSAIPQSRLVYTASDGTITEARSCRQSETRDIITMVRNTDLCSLRPGDQDGVFEEKAIWTYTVGNTVHQVGQCDATGVTYEYKTVYEGCQINVDKRQKAAIRQVRRQTYKNDVLQHSSACQNSTNPSDRYAFEKNHNACGIKTVLTAREATSWFNWFYTDSSGEYNLITGIAGADADDCVADSDRTYAIYEDHESCTNFLDYDNLKAIPQARLIYRTPDGRDHQVRSCEASESITAVNLEFNTILCPIEHDMRARKSYENGMYTFTIGGQAYQAGGCSRSDVEYLHTNNYDDCPPIQDLSSGYVTRQYRTQITVNGSPQLVSATCTPDAQGSRLPIVSTTDGCNAPRDWDHDIALGISYAKERFYYIDAGSNARTYLTQCQASEVSYRHNVEVVGYLHHDGQRADQQRSKVSISTPTGTYVIIASQVLPGTVLVPYVKARTGDQLIAAPTAADRTYVGCNAFDRTDRVEVWTRSDGTEYSRVIGDGDPAGPTNVCAQIVEAQWPIIRFYNGSIPSTSCGKWNDYNAAPGDSYVTKYFSRNTRTAVYEGTRNLTREDGEVISTETAEQTITVNGGCRSYSRPPNSRFPNPPSADQINQFLINVGWKQ